MVCNIYEFMVYNIYDMVCNIYGNAEILYVMICMLCMTCAWYVMVCRDIVCRCKTLYVEILYGMLWYVKWYVRQYVWYGMLYGMCMYVM